MRNLYGYSFSKCQASCFSDTIEKYCNCLSPLFGVGSLNFDPSKRTWCSMDPKSVDKACVEEHLKEYADQGKLFVNKNSILSN